MSTPCKYTGTALDCVGIETNDTIEVVFQKLAEYVCALELSPITNELVYYSETGLGSNTGGATPTYTTLANTTYTIPVGADGDYEINYVGEVRVSAENTIIFKVYKNGAAIGPYTYRKIESEFYTYVPFTLFLSNLTLEAGDVITIRSMSSDKVSTYPVNCVLKITKIS